MMEKIFEPGTVNYNSRIATNYPTARALSAETAETWSTVLHKFITPASTVLDLGCGTGRFSCLMAEQFEAHVIGLDPAFGMLQAGVRRVARGDIFYALARAKSLPLSDSSCDVAWLSHVIHHIPDPEACARELHRVVRRDGYVLIRGTFGDRLDGFPTLFRFFPGARQIAAQFPTLAQVIAVFRSVGFTVESLQSVQQKTCDSLREFAGRTGLRADSTLVLLPDPEFESCQTSLEQAAACEHKPSPVIETLDLLVLRAFPCTAV